MDDKLGASDPYRSMDSGEDGIQPDFLKSKKGGASGVLSAAESAASAIAGAKTGGAGSVAAKGASEAGKNGASGLEAAKGGAGGAFGGKKSFENGIKNAQEGETNPRGLYSGGRGEHSDEKDEAKFKLPKSVKAAAPFAILLVAMVAIIGFIIVLPVLMIGALDYNLMKALGFTETIGILEKVGSYVTADYLNDGKVPSEYASRLAAYGVDVGQVLANGDFVKTDTYIADIENRDDLVAAAGGFSYISEEEGELAILYNGEIIHADDFVAAVESNPTLYAAYSGAADIGTKYYYSKDVDEVYNDMGLSRGNFNDWKSTGNYASDVAKYEEILDKTLDQKSTLKVAGYYNDEDLADTSKVEEKDDGTLFGKIKNFFSNLSNNDEDLGGNFEKDVSSGSADEITADVAEKTKEYIIEWDVEEGMENNKIIKTPVPEYTSDGSGVGATKRAAELLNTAVSSGEPYLASSAFIAVEEPVQRARINGDGPVNEVMNTLTRGQSVSYQNVSTGEMESKNLSILETDNFRAAVSDSRYSVDEAANFARDRVIKTTGVVDEETIKSTTITTNGRKKSTSVVRNGLGDSADSGVLSKANESVDLAISRNNSELFQTVVGGNRVIEGGSFLSNTVNMKVVGAMPSNAETVAAYHQETKEVLARKAEAERATKNPFDITSPNTFMGAIVHNMATGVLSNYGRFGSIVTAVSTAASATGSALANIAGSAVAEGSGDDFTAMSGRDCATVGTIGVEGDLYCTSHNTISSKYKKEDWEGKIDDALYEEFVNVAMSRDATVGVKSAEVCEAFNNNSDVVTHFFSDIVGLFESCAGVEDDVATGSKYAFNGEGEFDAEIYAGKAVYEEVHKLLSGEETTADKIREEYYAKYPKDNSEAGLVARRSGMSKKEAEIALAYGDYLTIIALYDPSDRFMFGASVLTFEEPILNYHSDEIALSLYAWHSKESEYEDLRTRNFVV